MSLIGNQLNELFMKIPILIDDVFQKDYPGIVDVVSFIDSAASSHGTNYPLFKELDIESTNDFVELIRYGNEQAIRKYTKLRDILGFE